MFRPWIGEQYDDNSNMIGGLRLLIVGESYYAGHVHLIGTSDPDQANETILEYAIKAPLPFYKRAARLTTGQPTDLWSTEQHGAFWHSVAFHNFLTDFRAPPPQDQRPSSKEWQAGKAPFLQVLAETQPEILIVSGLDVWWYVMDALPGGAEANSPKRDTAQIGSGYGLRVPHFTGARGASAYSYEVSRPMYVQLLNERAG